MRSSILAALTIVTLCAGVAATVRGDISAPIEGTSATVLCYMNGDNDLSQEVLHALDMLETVGSSERVNVVVLVDGHQQWLGPYDDRWARTRLLRVEFDAELGKINSPVLEEWGEANLGSPDTLARFIRQTLTRYPATRYLFYTFAHSQGVIDTRRLTGPPPAKTVSISRDATDNAKMCLEQFHEALKYGLNGRRFDLMVLFSCLTNMVEIGYALSDVTHYLVASQDEIRLLNQPPGSYQIRGLHFEEIVAALKQNPAADVKLLGQKGVDTHVDNYGRDVMLPAAHKTAQACRYRADMAMVDCRALPLLVQQLDKMAGLMIAHSGNPQVVEAMRRALTATPQFASFLNLEYYDLLHFVRQLKGHLRQPDLITICDSIMAQLVDQVLVYERRTSDGVATGMSVYLSSPLVPENVYQAHQAMYAQSRFGQDTRWDEMISCFRQHFR
jgi:hypothetical protein